jgi:hypothetical protein
MGCAFRVGRLLIAQRSLMQRGQGQAKNAVCGRLLHRPMANGCRDAVIIPFFFPLKTLSVLSTRSFDPRRTHVLFSYNLPLPFSSPSSPLFVLTCVLSSHSFPWSPLLAPTRSSLLVIALDGPQGDATTSLGKGLIPIRLPSPCSSSIRCALLL